jgi:carbonic anhydrase
MPAMSKWLGYADKTARILKENYSHVTDKEALLNIAVQENVLVQLENISSLPCIAKKLSKREIELHGWVWKIETGQVFVYDHINEEFRDSAALSDDFESMPETNMEAASVARHDLLKTALRKAKTDRRV